MTTAATTATVRTVAIGPASATRRSRTEIGVASVSTIVTEIDALTTETADQIGPTRGERTAIVAVPLKALGGRDLAAPAGAQPFRRSLSQAGAILRDAERSASSQAKAARIALESHDVMIGHGAAEAGALLKAQPGNGTTEIMCWLEPENNLRWHGARPSRQPRKQRSCSPRSKRR